MSEKVREGYREEQPEEELNLSDFALFYSVMSVKEAQECTLSIIMDEPDLKLEKVHAEQVILNHAGLRAIRLDAWALDMRHRQFNMEMQNDIRQDDVRKRSRYYQGIIDTPVLKSGKKTKYRNLPSTVIIFITQEDIFGHDLAMYTFTEQCEEIQGLALEDGTKKIFLNMASKNGRADLVSLLQYMKNTTLENPELLVEDPRITKLDSIVTEVKESEEWESVRMSIYSRGIEVGEKIGEERGEARGEARGQIKRQIANILELLRLRGTVPEELEQRILAENNLDILKEWFQLAAKADSIEEFRGKMGI